MRLQPFFKILTGFRICLATIVGQGTGGGDVVEAGVGVGDDERFETLDEVRCRVKPGMTGMVKAGMTGMVGARNDEAVQVVGIAEVDAMEAVTVEETAAIAVRSTSGVPGGDALQLRRLDGGEALGTAAAGTGNIRK